MLLQDRLFVTAVEAVQTRKPLVEAAQYLVAVTRGVGKVTAADLAADHPFMVVTPGAISSGPSQLHCLRLNVTNDAVVSERIKLFRATRETRMRKYETKGIPLIIHAAQVIGAELLTIFREAEAQLVSSLAKPVVALSKESLTFFQPPSAMPTSVDVEEWQAQIAPLPASAASPAMDAAAIAPAPVCPAGFFVAPAALSTVGAETDLAAGVNPTAGI